MRGKDLDTTPKAGKKSINWTSSNSGLRSSKHAGKRMQRQATGCEKMLANHISGKGLVSRIYKNSQN